MLIEGGVRLGLRCDFPGCKNTYHPRRDGSVRRLARKRGWRAGIPVPGEDKQKDFCCKFHFQAGGGQDVHQA